MSRHPRDHACDQVGVEGAQVIELFADADGVDWQAVLLGRRDQWLPSVADEAYVKSLMQPVTEPGKVAGWIAPPAKGINGLPQEFEYVRLS